MEPTMNLRFVQRHEGANHPRFILQQRWEETGSLAHGRIEPRKTEWRDVPLEKEEE